MIWMYEDRSHFPRAVDGVLSPRSERTSFPGVGGGQPGLGAHQRSSGRRGSGCRLAAGGKFVVVNEKRANCANITMLLFWVSAIFGRFCANLRRFDANLRQFVY